MSIYDRANTHVPEEFRMSHDLCLLNHDVLVEIMHSGEKQKVFDYQLSFQSESERKELEEAENIFDWFENCGREKDFAKFLRQAVFPALLSDMLHFIYEALESSRKGKLNVTYALIRKPIQESLFVFEEIISDVDQFAAHLRNRPQSLRSQKIGGIDAHISRVNKVVRELKEDDRFDAEYIARLRYDKHYKDSFDRVSNLAMHLFTDHDALRTEKLNINFVFSGLEEKITQWTFLYSRLPYLLFYVRKVVEHVLAAFVRTDQEYVENYERQIAAGIVLWWPTVANSYKCPEIQHFFDVTRSNLTNQAYANNITKLTGQDLLSIQNNGNWPRRAWYRQIFKKLI